MIYVWWLILGIWIAANTYFAFSHNLPSLKNISCECKNSYHTCKHLWRLNVYSLVIVFSFLSTSFPFARSSLELYLNKIHFQLSFREQQKDPSHSSHRSIWEQSVWVKLVFEENNENLKRIKYVKFNCWLQESEWA